MHTDKPNNLGISFGAYRLTFAELYYVFFANTTFRFYFKHWSVKTLTTAEIIRAFRHDIYFGYDGCSNV